MHKRKRLLWKRPHGVFEISLKGLFPWGAKGYDLKLFLLVTISLASWTTTE